MRTSTPSFSNLIRTPLATLIILLAISLVLLFLPLRFSNQIKAVCVAPVRHLQWATCFCSNSASNFFDRVISTWQDAQIKTHLENQLSQFKNKITEQQDTIYKLQNKLQTISKFQAENKNIRGNTVPADIIGYDTSNFRKSLTINAGSKDGVKINNIVLSDNALVGKVVEVRGRNSIVQLITDPASRVPGRVLRTREQVIVEGNATGYCGLKYVPRWTKLKEGDIIVSSDIGGFCPPSIPVATIVECVVKGGALFQSVKALPNVDISKIENVLVITD